MSEIDRLNRADYRAAIKLSCGVPVEQVAREYFLEIDESGMELDDDVRQEIDKIIDAYLRRPHGGK